MKLWVTNPLFPERLTVEAVLVEDQGRLQLQVGGQPVGALEAQALGLSVYIDDAAVLDSMGWVQYRLGDYPKALDYLRRAYQANQDAEIAAHFSEVLWVSGQREEAKKVWREAQRKTPDSRHLRQLQERFGW